MRRYLVVAIATLTLAGGTMAADSPIAQGSLILGGNIYVERTTGELYRDQTTVAIHPDFMYFVSPGFAIGINVLWDHYHGRTDLTTLSIGPQIAVYIDTRPDRAKAGGSIIPFIRIFANYYTESYSYDLHWYDTSDNTFTGSYVGGNVGAAVFLSRSISLDVGLVGSRDNFEDHSGWTLRLGMGLTGYLY